MTKDDIIYKIRVITGVGHEEVSVTVEAFMKTIKSALRDGHTIYLRGFGKFKPILRKQKVGQNMNTGESIVIPAKTVAKFFPSKKYFKL